ncbi:tagatose-bisphosphate aldolase [Candidatus Nomurabacteria bacterium CG10_big_fil_rev_8_21_14_0_10_35_16]|uniref:Tagatose-bisphosphate aldolase n=1 Tax=Candidatus Nomurabacteria bacterium CG10_big_fil_rev_8_21_14_0_10_35_16 TaxID=1974731 RepID=A0A2H0TAV1_9BACT|nr:MAG: tagatose-bisphosphate aldolase [Candidatus Nomurabacteria bacterium CG10_big_fil_rev_8_21_14_0_10_35_16]
MKTLREYIQEADEQGTAICHFNVSNLEALHGIYVAAKKLNLPIIIGVSEGEEAFIGKEEIVALVRAIKERDKYPIFLNADHHYSFETVKGAIDAGFDAVVIDAVKLPIEENIALTKKCVDYAREFSKKYNKDVLVEAELGFIGQSSKIIDQIPDGVSEDTMTTPEDARRFVEATGVDLLAPSIGNVHGMVKSGNPRLHPERVKAIREAVGIPLVLHGGSGSMDEDFLECIKTGIDIVHINTEIRIAFTEALRKSLADNPEEITPYKYLSNTVTAVAQVVESRLKLFNGIK